MLTKFFEENMPDSTPEDSPIEEYVSEKQPMRLEKKETPKYLKNKNLNIAFKGKNNNIPTGGKVTNKATGMQSQEDKIAKTPSLSGVFIDEIIQSSSIIMLD